MEGVREVASAENGQRTTSLPTMAAMGEKAREEDEEDLVPCINRGRVPEVQLVNNK